MGGLSADVAPDPPRRLEPITLFLDPSPYFDLLMLAGLAFGIVYGLVWALRRTSPARTVFKTLPLGLYAIGSLALLAPGLLSIGLAFSAAGDAFLAAEGRRRFALGLGSFLLAHLAYIGLFLASSTPEGWSGLLARVVVYSDIATGEPWRIGGIIATLVVALALAAWLWRGLGAMQAPVAAYIACIVAMVSSAFLLFGHRQLALPGALLFMASDAILAIQVFRPNAAWARRGWAKLAVWFLYLTGQTLITAAFV